MVAEDLELDVAGTLEVLLDVDVAVAEGGFGLALRGPSACGSSPGLRTIPHPSPTAAGHGLDDHGIADVLGHAQRGFLPIDRAVAARQHRQARLLHGLARARLVAEAA
jgi:hypothetical protein